MLTKKKNGSCLPLFMDWRILENYNLYLDDVNIPMREIPSVDTTKEIFKDLVNEFRQNLESGNWNEHGSLSEKISQDLNELQFPDFLVDEIFLSFLLDENHGTFFVIFDPNEQLLELTQGDRIELREDPTTNYLRSSLSGINNAFKDERCICLA